MFTGIITAVGRVEQVQTLGQGADFGVRVWVNVPAGYLDDVGLGDSIAMQGACMTVTQLHPAQQQFVVEVSAESLHKTRGYAQGERINLEKALRAHDRLGGHIVTGHVDALAQVQRFESVGESWLLVVRVPPALAKFFAYKGSITVNGTSLTVNSVQDHAEGCDVSINLIDHTVNHTALGDLQVGAAVNVEVDLIARYCERMLGERMLGERNTA
jgi:riboflavin synthase